MVSAPVREDDQKLVADEEKHNLLYLHLSSANATHREKKQSKNRVRKQSNKACMSIDY